MASRLAKKIVRIWSNVVPPHTRAEWEKEWNAEIDHQTAAHPHRRLALIRRAMFAGTDAFTVRQLHRRAHATQSNARNEGTRKMVLATLKDDIRYALRTLRRNPTFTFAALVTIALGVGANTAVFSVVDGILWRSLDYPEANRLVAIWPAQWFSPREVVRFQEELNSYQHFGAYSQDGQTFSDTQGNATFIEGPVVSADFFDTLGQSPNVGRSFADGEDRAGSNRVVVLSHQWWQNQFASDTGVVGSTITLNESPHTVIGVMPPGLDFLQKDAQFARPLALTEGQPSFDGRWLQLVGRLRPGVEIDQAKEELSAVVSRWKEIYDYEENYGSNLDILPLRDALVGPVQTSLFLLLGAVGLTLLVAVINVANLLLARAVSRQREFTIRAALGAHSSRLIRQLLTESMVLGTVGGLLGAGAAWWGVKAIVTLLPDRTPRLESITVDLRVLLFAAAVAIGTGLLIGLAPALQSILRTGRESVGTGVRGASVGRGQKWRSILVSGEMTFAVVLLVGSGLLLRSLWTLNQRDLGIDADALVAFHAVPPRSINTDAMALNAYYDRLLEGVAALPGVESAGAIHIKPVSNGGWVMGVATDPADGEPPEGFQGAWWRPVTNNYMHVTGMRLLAGRVFTRSDDASTQQVAVVNETMANEFWPGQDPIGKRFRVGFEGNEDWTVVVGVTANVKHLGVTEDTPATVYRPYAQTATPLSTRNILQRTILARVRVDPDVAALELARAAPSLAPGTPFVDLRPMRDVVRESLAEPRALTVLLTIFAGLTLTLGAVGVYGLVAYSVSQRLPEIGIRLALGATAQDIVRHVVWGGIKLAVVGVSLGLAIAFGVSRVYASVLHDVSARDPLIFAVVPALLLGVAALTSYVPAFKAGRADPTIALKAD